jgi:hypothetical protein
MHPGGPIFGASGAGERVWCLIFLDFSVLTILPCVPNGSQYVCQVPNVLPKASHPYPISFLQKLNFHNL